MFPRRKNTSDLHEVEKFCSSYGAIYFLNIGWFQGFLFGWVFIIFVVLGFCACLFWVCFVFESVMHDLCTRKRKKK